MKCPRCVQRVHRAAESCPHCGFTIDDADQLFGEGEVVLEKFCDAAGVLRQRERIPLRNLVDRFEDQFPQLFFSIYLGAFDELPSIRQFGFWLLNRAAYTDIDLTRPNSNGILLVIDVNSRTAGFTTGYGVSPFLTDPKTFQILSKAHPFLLQNQYLPALKLIIKQTAKALKKTSRKARRDLDAFLPRPTTPVQSVLQRLRQRHQAPKSCLPTQPKS